MKLVLPRRGLRTKDCEGECESGSVCGQAAAVEVEGTVCAVFELSSWGMRVSGVR